MKSETMELQDNKYIAVAYQLYADIDGNRELIEETADGQPFIFITGMGITLPAFENNLATLDKDANFDFIIPQDEAYGEYVDERVVDLDK
ncbi:MAG: FKBP-type peptidyl-prolyl cis-trans isomerase, partial [Prevotella sp.]|nr:FKBP-type peptidyl-prolyl cis-trans isomerase [Prevotella sp.]